MQGPAAAALPPTAPPRPAARRRDLAPSPPLPATKQDDSYLSSGPARSLLRKLPKVLHNLADSTLELKAKPGGAKASAELAGCAADLRTAARCARGLLLYPGALSKVVSLYSGCLRKLEQAEYLDLKVVQALACPLARACADLCTHLPNMVRPLAAWL